MGQNKELQAQPENTQLAKPEDERRFEFMWRKASMMSSSNLVPVDFRGQQNIPNCMIAMEMADRMQMNALMIMQNIVLIHGKPSWPSQFIISMINSSGRFSPLKFKMSGEGDDWSCIAYATEKESGDQLKSPKVSIAMAKAEGWYQKKGSKWQTMPELMLRYRSAAFFGRLYAPEYLNGMQTREEVIDIEKGDYESLDNSGDSNNRKTLEIPEAEKIEYDEVKPEADPKTEPPKEDVQKKEEVSKKNEKSVTDVGSELYKILSIATDAQIEELKKASGITDFQLTTDEVKKKLIKKLNEIIDSDGI